MKRLINVLLVLALMLMAAAIFAQADTAVVDPIGGEGLDLWAFINENLAELLLGLLMLVELVVRFTPTEKDDSWFLWLKKIFDAIFPTVIKKPDQDPANK